MRLIFTLFSLLLLTAAADAQKLTGIWRGYFSSTIQGMAREEMYKFEIQIDQQSNNGIRGVTYSYKTTVFYGKAEIQGIFTAQTKSLILRETRLVDLKVSGESEPCLMTCYLDYSKVGKLEFLQGTFISINQKDKGDCGSGKVYLERVATSDFKKEDFLTKKKEGDSSKDKSVLNIKPKTTPTITPPATTEKAKPLAAVPPPVKKNPVTEQKNTGKPLSKDDKSKTPVPPARPERIPVEAVHSSAGDSSASRMKVENHTQKIIIPQVLLDRQNPVVKTIVTDQEDIVINFFDNGSIDNDTITVYHNNQLVVNSERLTYNAISFKIKCSKEKSHHEIVVVADNLGEIPPNTALMVILEGGKKRTEVFLDTNEQRNAKVIIEYKPKQ